MIELAHDINYWTSIPAGVLFGAVVTVLVLPVSFFALVFGYFLPKPLGVIAGTLVGMAGPYPALQLWNCWTCTDHPLDRRFIGPAAAYLGGLAMGYAIARLGLSGKKKYEQHMSDWPKRRNWSGR